MVFSEELPPSGFVKDGPSQVYRRFTVAAGSHTIAARLRDTPQTSGFDHERIEAVQSVLGKVSRLITARSTAASSGADENKGNCTFAFFGMAQYRRGAAVLGWLIDIACRSAVMTPADWSIVNGVPVSRSMADTLSHRVLRSHARGELLFQQGDPATCCFLVLDGWVKLYRQTTDGDEVVVSLFTAGESFAEAIMFRGGRYPATAEAVTSVRLLHIDGQLLRDVILRNPQISFEMLAASSLHLRRLVEQVEQLEAQSAPKRIASFLLSLTSVRRGPARIELP